MVMQSGRNHWEAIGCVIKSVDSAQVSILALPLTDGEYLTPCVSVSYSLKRIIIVPTSLDCNKK